MFTEEAIDSGGMWNPAQPTRVTCVEDGVYYITANAFWDPNAVGYRRIRIRRNTAPNTLAGSSQMAVTVAGIATDQVAAVAAWQATVGEFLVLRVIQDSGGALQGHFALKAFKIAQPQ